MNTRASCLCEPTDPRLGPTSGEPTGRSRPRSRTLYLLLLLCLLLMPVPALIAPLVKADNIMTIGRRGDSTTLDPIASIYNRDFRVYSNIYDQLVRVDHSGTELEMGLADSWHISDDGRVYTFRLRIASFSDGSPITSADVAYSLQRIRDSERSKWSDPFNVIDSIATPTDRIVVITLKNPSVPFLSLLAIPAAGIVSQASAEALNGQPDGQMPVFSGAFMVSDWERGEWISLRRNPEFWEADQVRLDGVDWVVVADDYERVRQLRAGRLDAAVFVPYDSVAELEADPDINMLTLKAMREDHLLINHSRGLLRKKKVRQALEMLVDKQAIIEEVTLGIATEANSYISEGALYHYADNPREPYDPDRARALLREAGAENLQLVYLVTDGDEVKEKTAELIKQQFARAGVEVIIRKLEYGKGWDTVRAGEYDLAVVYWVDDTIDPDQKTTFLLGHNVNRNLMTRYESAEVRELVAAARQETDPSRREALYVKLQKIAKDDVVWIDLYYSPHLVAIRKNIENFHQNPLGRVFLEEVIRH